MKININIKDVSKILLINSIISVDKENNLLTEEKIRQSNSKLEGENIGTPIQAEVKRAEFLIMNIEDSVPWLCKAGKNISIFSWKVTVLIMIFFGFLGAGFQFYETKSTFHVLSRSLFGLLLWNFISIFLLIISPFLLRSIFSFFKKKNTYRLDSEAQSTNYWTEYIILILQKTYHWLISKNPDIKKQETANKALIEFMKEWRKLIAKVFRYEYLKIVHLSMISFTSSTIIISFINGLTKSYKAIIESTFLTNNQIISIIDFVFIPSKLILGELPDIPNTNGIIGTATPWIYHYMVTLALFVLIPRFFLFLLVLFKSYYLKSNFPIPKELIFKDTLNIALASHTNIGKTSLLRTLLKRDVGEVSNEENVTKKSSGYFLLNEQDARLKIWDTPGFNNVNNLVDKIKKSNLDDFLKKHKKKDKLNIEALSALKNEADLILFLVPAESDSKLLKTIHQELTILFELKKPIICTVNRLEKEDNKKNEDSLNKWKEFFSSYNISGEFVIPLDAHYRTLEDEELFFEKITEAINSESKALAKKIHTYYKDKKDNQFNKLSTVISTTLIELCKIYEENSNKDSIERLKKRSNKYILEATENIINIIGLDHDINEKIVKKIKEKIKQIPLKHEEAFVDAVKGGALVGITTGTATALVDGGFGLIAGLIIGGIAGGIGSFILSYSYREVKYKGEKIIIWDEKFIRDVSQRLILNYLTFSVYGRARGTITNKEIFENTQILLESSVKSTLEIHWKTLWEDLKIYQKKNDTNLFGKIFDKMNPLTKNKTKDENTIIDKCGNILKESNRSWLNLRNKQDSFDNIK